MLLIFQCCSLACGIHLCSSVYDILVLILVALSLDGDDDDDGGDLMLDGTLSSSRTSALPPAQKPSARAPARKRKKQRYLVSTKKPLDAPKRFKRYMHLGFSMHTANNLRNLMVFFYMLLSTLF